MKLLDRSLQIEMTLEEAMNLFHICTYVRNDERCWRLRQDAGRLADLLASFDCNKLGPKT